MKSLNNIITKIYFCYVVIIDNFHVFIELLCDYNSTITK